MFIGTTDDTDFSSSEEMRFILASRERPTLRTEDAQKARIAKLQGYLSMWDCDDLEVLEAEWKRVNKRR